MIRPLLNTSMISVLLLLSGCTNESDSRASESTESTVVSTAESGLVSIEVATQSLAAESGEPIELLVTLKAPEEARARLILDESEPLGSFNLLHMEDALAVEDVFSVAERRRLLISTFESGNVTLPPIQVEWGEAQRLATEPIEFSIKSLVDGDFDPSDYAEIRGPVDDSLPETDSKWIMPLAIGGGATLLAVLAIALIVAGRRRPRPRIPHEWALAELARIRAENPASQGATDEVFARIETVLRWYVAFRFGIDAPDQTSKELLSAISAHGSVDDDARALLERLIRNGDRIKFAGGFASREDCLDALNSVQRFVEQTIPASQEEAA